LGAALADATGLGIERLRPFIVYINGAAWDAATQAVLAARCGGSMAIDPDRFLDLMAAGIEAAMREESTS
jgi:hypothetical protein